MAKRVQTEAQKEYQKERRRLLQAVRRGQQKGYIFPEDVVPPLPKHVTHKQLEKIKATRPTDLYQVAKRVDFATGEILDSSQQRVSQRTEEPKPSKRKIAKVDSRIKHPRLSTPKEELTEEEKHRRAVERGRKAWATRRAKMTDEQYRDYVETFKRRMQTARQRKTQEDYPTFSAIDKVRESLEELDNFYALPQEVYQRKNEFYDLHRMKYPWYDDSRSYYYPQWASCKGLLISIFDNIIEEWKDNISDYEDYLIARSEEIEYELAIIRYYSDWAVVEKSFAKLVSLLKIKPISMEEAESISLMSEAYYNPFEEI